MAPLNRLRPITHRLNSTAVEDLPQYAECLAAAISNCKASLLSVDSQKNDESVQVHKLTTRVSSLLQDRTQEGRFTGVVLAKALIEAGGSQILTSSGLTWARALVSCMGRPDPPQLKQLVVLTITRIFLLTRDNQTAIREITTPVIPAFLNACLNAIKPAIISKDGVERQIPSLLLQPVLQSWANLMTSFSSTFRPFLPSIRGITLSLMSQLSTSIDVKDIAAQVFASLHFCAPKDSSSSEWIQSVRSTIEAAHQAADLAFRSIIEDWTSASPRTAVSVTSKKSSKEVHSTTPDAVGMDKWNGVQNGCARIVELLRLLRALTASQHAQAVAVPMTEILNLTARCVAVVLPTKTYALRENKEISRDEREELYLNLPSIYCAVLDLQQSMAHTYGSALLPLSRPILSQIWEILDSAVHEEEVRIALYKTFEVCVKFGVVSLETVDGEHIANLIDTCCSDLMSTRGRYLSSHGDVKALQNGTMNLNTQPRGKRETMVENSDSLLTKAAWILLPLLFSDVPVQLLTSSTRAELDRVSILLGHEQAMFASVMNPVLSRSGARASSSILPFLAHKGSGLAFEALMRPRNPVLQSTSRSLVNNEAGGENVDVSLQEDDISADANLHVVTAHVTQQLESNTPLDESDVQSFKKRDHDAIEEPTKSTIMEQSKRARTQSPINIGMELAAATPAALPESNIEAGAASTTIDRQDTPEVTSVNVTMSEKYAAVPVMGGSSSDTVKARISHQDDDSDDSEIPMIDTALSSDEDEDANMED